jgi:hypothetical protein
MAKRYEQADVRWNSGAGALLCNDCSKIIAYGFEHEDKEHFCEKCLKKEEKEIKYLIQFIPGESLYRLFSLVQTDFGTVPAKNFICEGTYKYCEEVKEKLQAA